jgi:hypothetical protein
MDHFSEDESPAIVGDELTQSARTEFDMLSYADYM